ncbi:hypothetical protein [Nocardiopsis sp. NPDC057823]|uniref:hypothetical protein n=1 Tax=Nocardiopsis sp. NPDC057823 TaxID=3346256 RepID=UPI00366AA452
MQTIWKLAYRGVITLGAAIENRLDKPLPLRPAPADPGGPTTAQRQARALVAAVSVIASETELPPVSWTVSDVSPDCADGHVHTRSNTRDRAAVAAWARALETEVTETPSRDGQWATVSAEACRGSVTLRVWARIDLTAERG